MPRIECLPVEQLTDLHLDHEMAAIKDIMKNLEELVAKKTLGFNDIPPEFKVNGNNSAFFYNKGKYLFRRYE